MAFLRKKKSEEEEIEEEERLEKQEIKADKKLSKKFKDLAPKNKRKRKEPPKPWGKRERLIVLIMFLATVITAFILTASARGLQTSSGPTFNLPKINFDSLNIFGEKTIIIEKK